MQDECGAHSEVGRGHNGVHLWVPSSPVRLHISQHLKVLNMWQYPSIHRQNVSLKHINVKILPHSDSFDIFQGPRLNVNAA